MATRAGDPLPAVIHDPIGELHGLPTYNWTTAPAHLATRRQLTAMGLRPGGQRPVGQIRRRGLIGYLYQVDKAKPKFTLTPAKLRAVWLAAQSRRRCGDCAAQLDYIPQQGAPTYGRCWDCMGYPPAEPAAVSCPACSDVEWMHCPACASAGGREGMPDACGHCRGEGLIPCVLCQDLTP